MQVFVIINPLNCCERVKNDLCHCQILITECSLLIQSTNYVIVLSILITPPTVLALDSVRNPIRYSQLILYIIIPTLIQY